MTKIDVFQTFEDTNMKRMQAVYLNAYGFTAKEISKWVSYAESTIKTYIRKFADLLDKAKKTFYHVTKKVKKVLQGGRQLVYLFKFYDSDGKLVCSKVGTTTRLPEERMKEEIKSYQKSKDEVVASIDHAEICSVIDCGAIPCEGAESITRAAFIRRFPDTFKKNDRFMGVDLPVVTFNRIVKNYLAEEIAY
jgi:hypothetical protein